MQILKQIFCNTTTDQNIILIRIDLHVWQQMMDQDFDLGFFSIQHSPNMLQQDLLPLASSPGILQSPGITTPLSFGLSSTRYSNTLVDSSLLSSSTSTLDGFCNILSSESMHILYHDIPACIFLSQPWSVHVLLTCIFRITFLWHNFHIYVYIYIHIYVEGELLTCAGDCYSWHTHTLYIYVYT